MAQRAGDQTYPGESAGFIEVTEAAGCADQSDALIERISLRQLQALLRD